MAVAWLLFAPVVAVLLSFYSPEAMFYFNTVSSLIILYYKKNISRMFSTETTIHQENEEIILIAKELCGAEHYTIVWDALSLAEKCTTLDLDHRRLEPRIQNLTQNQHRLGK